MKKIFLFILLFIFFLTNHKTIFAQEKKYFIGKIEKITIEENKDNKIKKLIFDLKINDVNIKINQIFDKHKNYRVGDRVLVSLTNNQYFIEDHYRLNKLIIIFLIFLIIIFFIIGKKSFGIILSIFFSLFILFTSIIPNIVSGYDPVVSSIFGCLIIVPVNFYFTHGFNKKTSIAVLGTLIALIFTGFLSYLTSLYLNISETTSE